MASERVIAVDGARLWTATSGSSEPGVVLCHGGPGMSDNLGALAAMLDDCATVHRYDQRGGGRSDSRGPFDVATFVADLEALRQDFGHGSWFVGGHSWGALLALMYALAYPDRTLGVVYVSGPGLSGFDRGAFPRAKQKRLTAQEQATFESIDSRLKSDEAVSDSDQLLAAALRWKTEFVNPPPVEELMRAPIYSFPKNDQVNREVVMDADRLMSDPALPARLRGLDIPVLMIHGAEDPRGWELTRDLSALLPRSRFELLAEAGHLPWFEKAAEVRRFVRAFVLESD